MALRCLHMWWCLPPGFVRLPILAHDLHHEEDGSLTVDETLCAAPGVWAVGDIASYPAPEGRRRIEHWRVAQQQGRLAAKNMLGEHHAFDQGAVFLDYPFRYAL